MKLRRNKLLSEPPAGASSDIAFILIVFFLVCASVQPEQGRPQLIPKTEEEPDTQEKNKNPEVELTRTVVILNGDPLTDKSFPLRLNNLLAGKQKTEDKVDGSEEEQEGSSLPERAQKVIEKALELETP